MTNVAALAICKYYLMMTLDSCFIFWATLYCLQMLFTVWQMSASDRHKSTSA